MCTTYMHVLGQIMVDRTTPTVEYTVILNIEFSMSLHECCVYIADACTQLSIIGM